MGYKYKYAKIVNKFGKCVVSQDKDELRKYLCEYATIRWHCTNECFGNDGTVSK